MHITQKLIASSVAILSLLLPTQALAAPGNVRNIELQKADDGILVRWDAAGEDMASYKIFWSKESILENDAVYDDVVDTEQAVTVYVLKDLPEMDDVYVTILAVDENGDESPLFEEEAHLSLKENAEPAEEIDDVEEPIVDDVPATDDSPSIPALTLRALQVDVLSATGIAIRFSAPVVLTAQTVQSAFDIKDGSGSKLQIYRVRSDKDTVWLDTLPQVRGRAYRLHVDPVLKGTTGNADAVLTLDPDQMDLLFGGHASGVEAPQTVSQGNGPDVSNVRVSATPDGRNTYTVEMSWTAPQGTVSGYRIAQTRDGGQNYSSPQTLPGTVTSIRMPQTQAGDIGVLIQAMGENGQLSRGVLQRVILPQTTGGRVVSQAPVGSTIPKNTRLPQTGVGTGTLLAIAGACAGTHLQRRRKRA